METGKSAKYFKYAIGEIILVVIGILIALQINNWNEERKIHKAEQEALVNLKEDFVYNKVKIDSLIAELKEQVNMNLKVLDYTGAKPKPDSEKAFDSLLNYLGATKRYSPRNGYLNDLINSGKLGIIKNEELRNKLSLFLPAVENVNNLENSSLQFDYSLISFIIKNGSWLNADAVHIGRDIVFPKSGFDIDNRELLNYPEFENMVENHIIFINVLKVNLIKTSQLLEDILKLINSEIK